MENLWASVKEAVSCCLATSGRPQVPIALYLLNKYIHPANFLLFSLYTPEACMAKIGGA